MFIRGPDLNFYPSRIQGLKRNQIPDPGSRIRNTGYKNRSFFSQNIMDPRGPVRQIEKHGKGTDAFALLRTLWLH